MVILVVFNSFNVVKNLKKPDLVPRPKPPFYTTKLVRQQILKARTHKIKDLLNNMKDKRNDYQLVFNITYHPNFSKLKDAMSFLHLLLTPDQEHQKVFHKVLIIDF